MALLRSSRNEVKDLGTTKTYKNLNFLHVAHTLQYTLHDALRISQYGKVKYLNTLREIFIKR